MFYKVCLNDDHRLTLSYFTTKFRNLDFSIGKGKSGFFETIAACYLNIGRCDQLDEKIKVCECSNSRPFLDFGLRSFTYQKKKKISEPT